MGTTGLITNFEKIINNITAMTECLISNLWAVWTAIAIVCLIIELGSGDFFVTCFAIGALCAMLTSFFCAPLWLQVLVFALCSVLSIIFIRPSLLRHVHNHKERLSNADALIGRTGTVIEPIAPEGFGYVKVDGDEWKAQTHADTTINVGETVRIVARDSIIVRVERV